MSRMETPSDITPAQLNRIGVGRFPGYLGIEITRVVANAASGKTIAVFRCTQMILYPKAN